MNILFLNEKHKSHFQLARASLPEGQRTNRFTLSFLFLVTGDRALERKLGPYIHIKEARFLIPDTLLNQEMEKGTSILVALSFQILSENKTNLCLSRLDELSSQQLKLVLNALLVQREGAEGFRYLTRADDRYYYYM